MYAEVIYGTWIHHRNTFYRLSHLQKDKILLLKTSTSYKLGLWGAEILSFSLPSNFSITTDTFAWGVPKGDPTPAQLQILSHITLIFRLIRENHKGLAPASPLSSKTKFLKFLPVWGKNPSKFQVINYFFSCMYRKKSGCGNTHKIVSSSDHANTINTYEIYTLLSI